MPLIAAAVLGLATWVNSLLGNQNLGPVSITLAALGALVAHLAITRLESPRFTAVAAVCALALSGLQVGLSTSPRLADVPTFVVFGAAAWAVGRGREGHTFQRRERLGRAAFAVAMLAVFAGVGVLGLYLLITANGASWG